MITENDIKAYVDMPTYFTEGCSNNMFVFRADGGNHFTDYGIFEGMFLFFDTQKPFKKGSLSCYENKTKDENPRFKVSDKPLAGYKHFGRLVLTVRNYEV